MSQLRIGDTVIRKAASGVMRRCVVTGVTSEHISVRTEREVDHQGTGNLAYFTACLYRSALERITPPPTTTTVATGEQLDLFGATA